MSVTDGVNGTVCNAQQYQQFLSHLDDPDPVLTCLTHGETIGFTVSIHPCLSFSCIYRASPVQLSIAVAFLSILSMFSVYIWIGVGSTLPRTRLCDLTRRCIAEHTMVQEKRPER
jgi:hypothetical protein